MNLLILGGTVFLGRHIVESALARGHSVTLFNRGQHNADLFPDVEKLRGDRDGNLAALAGREWDAVVDTCGYVPRLVHDSTQLLADAVEHYTFISSISVYPDPGRIGIDEETPVGTLPDPHVEQVTGETYGPLKALCERAAETSMPGRVLNVRAGLIVGPHDPTDRFTYWPVRVARGGEVLAPDAPSCPAQFIDARDLADWIVRMAEARKGGVYNATGPAAPYTLGELLETCRDVSGSDARFTWAGEAFLQEQEVAPFVEMPQWTPAAAAGMQQVNIAKALGDDLTVRPVAETVADTLAWARERPEGYEMRAGLAPERERALLDAWRAL